MGSAGDKNDFDSPWKEALEKFLRPFLALCFPTIEEWIDWSRDVMFLDKELQSIQHDAEAGRQYVDKLIRVTTRDGLESWILVHIEVQAQVDAQLPQRLYRYFQALDQIHRRPVLSLAVLADGDPNFRPHTYIQRHRGCGVQFDFLSCKLLDLPEERLQRKGDPIARIIQAHRAALITSRDSPERRMRKLELLRYLKEEENEFARGELHQVLRLLDWLLQLSEPEEIKLRQELAELEPETSMPYVTSFERFARQEGRQEGLERGREEGREEGLRQAVREVLLIRFGEVPRPVEEGLIAAADADRLGRWHRLALTAPSLASVSETIIADR